MNSTPWGDRPGRFGRRDAVYLMSHFSPPGDRRQQAHRGAEDALRGIGTRDGPTGVMKELKRQLAGRTGTDRVAGSGGRAGRLTGRIAQSTQSTQSTRSPIPCPSDDELAKLDSLPAARPVVGLRAVRLTNLDTVLFPPLPGEDALTKRDLIRYAARVAPTLLPSPAGPEHAPVPEQVSAQWVSARRSARPRPALVARWDNPGAEPGQTRTYLVVDEPAALVWAPTSVRSSGTPGPPGPRSRTVLAMR